MRIGLKHQYAPGSKLVFTGVYQDAESEGYNEGSELVPDPSGFVFDVEKKLGGSLDDDGYLVEFQHLLSKERFSLVSGFGLFPV